MRKERYYKKGSTSARKIYTRIAEADSFPKEHLIFLSEVDDADLTLDHLLPDGLELVAVCLVWTSSALMTVGLHGFPTSAQKFPFLQWKKWSKDSLSPLSLKGV